MKKLTLIIVLVLLFSSCVKNKDTITGQKQVGETQSPTISIDNTATLEHNTPPPIETSATAVQNTVILSREKVTIESYELSEDLQVNQVGYLLDSRKVFWVTGEAKEYSLININTQEIVYTDQVTMIGIDDTIGNISGYGDFSNVQEEGEYFVAIDGKLKSFNFVISKNTYERLSESMLKMLYYQRCGVEISEEYAGEYLHDACHDRMGMIWDTDIEIDGTGGWHDAGDYGQYSAPCARTIADLLFAYQLFPSVFSDDTNIPESGNDIPDVLDEARVGLEWLKKMQRDDGGVYHKYTATNFENMVMPQDDYLNRYAMDISPTATASFCAIMAKAAVMFDEIDKEFADSCKKAATLSYVFLKENPDMLLFKNPDGVMTGEYGDTSDQDERYWAAVELYLLTNEIQYLNDAKELYPKKITQYWVDTLGWDEVGFLGDLSYLLLDNPDKGSEFYKMLYSSIVDTAEKIVELSNRKAFFVAMNKEDYIWGSNLVVTNRANILLMVNKINPDSRYIETAQAHLDYLMGTNALSQSYITGFGQKSIMHPHHRPSFADGIRNPIPGMVSGGPNAGLQDSEVQAIFDKSTPAALCFLDNASAYSTNEVAIYWNSSALFCVSGLISNK